MSSRCRSDLPLVAAAALGWVVIALGALPGGVLAPLATVLALILPGYCVVRAVDPRRVLAGSELLALTLGVGIGVTIVAGLALNFLGGLRSGSWVAALAGISLAAALVTWKRGGSLSPRGLPAVRVPLRAAMLTTLVGAVLAAALLVAVRGAEDARARVQFSQLWIDPAGAKRVGVRNLTARHETYRLTLSGAGAGRAWQLSLAPGATWTSPPVSAPSSPRLTALRALLQPLRPGERTLSVTLWVPPQRP